MFSAGVGTCKQNVKLDFHLNDHAVGTVAQNVQNHQEYMTQEDDSLRQCFNKLAGPILEQSRDINSDTYTLSPNEANYSTGYNRNGSESRLPSDGPTSSFKRAPIELLGMVRYGEILFQFDILFQSFHLTLQSSAFSLADFGGGIS